VLRPIDLLERWESCLVGSVCGIGRFRFRVLETGSAACEKICVYYMNHRFTWSAPCEQSVRLFYFVFVLLARASKADCVRTIKILDGWVVQRSAAARAASQCALRGTSILLTVLSEIFLLPRRASRDGRG